MAQDTVEDPDEKKKRLVKEKMAQAVFEMSGQDPQEGPGMPTSDMPEYPPPPTQDAVKNAEMHKAVIGLQEDPSNSAPQQVAAQQSTPGFLTKSKGLVGGISQMLAAALPVAFGAALGGKAGASLGAGVGANYLHEKHAEEQANDTMLHKFLLQQANEQAKSKSQLQNALAVEDVKNKNRKDMAEDKAIDADLAQANKAGDAEALQDIKDKAAMERTQVMAKSKPTQEDKASQMAAKERQAVLKRLTAGGNPAIRPLVEGTGLAGKIRAMLSDENGNAIDTTPEQSIRVYEALNRYMTHSRANAELIKAMNPDERTVYGRLTSKFEQLASNPKAIHNKQFNQQVLDDIATMERAHNNTLQGILKTETIPYSPFQADYPYDFSNDVKNAFGGLSGQEQQQTTQMPDYSKLSPEKRALAESLWRKKYGQ